jgi:hypothetical protein
MQHNETYYSYCAKGKLNLAEENCGIIILKGRNPISENNFRRKLYLPVVNQNGTYQVEIRDAQKGMRELNKKGLEIMARKIENALRGKRGNCQLNLEVFFTDLHAEEEIRRDRDKALEQLIEQAYKSA